MTVADVLRAVRGRWVLFAACCVIPLVAALAVVHKSPRVYASNAGLYVSPIGAFAGPNEYNGILVAQQEATSYAGLATSPAVMGPVIAHLHLATTPSQLAGQVIATSHGVFIDVTVHSSSAASARAIANDAALRLAALTKQFEGTRARERPPVKLTLVSPAVLQPAPVSPRKKLDLALGLVVGIIAGFVAVILREKTDPRVRTAQQAQSSTGCNLVTTAGGDRRTAWPPVRRPEPGASTAESFRRLRLRLAPALAANHAQSVAVASLQRSDPGPAAAANLALALAEDGSTIALVDTDAHAGLIATYFGLDGAADDDMVPWETAIQRYRENLLILPAAAALGGERQISPARLADLLIQLEKISQRTVVHVGPVLTHAAAAELGGTARTVLLVVQKDKTRQKDLRLAAQMLRSAGADLTGVVLAPARLLPGLSDFRDTSSGTVAVLAAAANGHGPGRAVAPSTATVAPFPPETGGQEH
jgi:capsular polysaccharide biosynthesis protein/Mrp family chromosome partitioning ATPase